MLDNLFDKLADDTVPPPPEALAGDVHRRVNRHLATIQTLDLLLRTAPLACWQFGRAVVALGYYTLTGAYREPSRGNPSKK